LYVQAQVGYKNHLKIKSKKEKEKQKPMFRRFTSFPRVEK